MQRLVKLFAVWVVLVVVVSARAELKLPTVIGDHMVLQRNKPVTIWGWADPGAAVEVQLDKQSCKAKADKEGLWSVELKSLKAGGAPLTLTVKSGEQQIEVTDILVGEVWVCSGQSNMQMAVVNSLDAEKEAAAANFPNIRLFDVPRQANPSPQKDVAATWTACTPDTVKSFTAVGYFFGRELHKELGVPIGLIGSNFGGTPAEAWTSREALEAKPSLKPLLERWDKQVESWNPEQAEAAWKAAAEKAAAEGKRAPAKPQNPAFSPHSPAGLYNAMIAPISRYDIAGAIWYQGESNVSRAYQYRTIFPAMIQDWRDRFDDSKLPFYFVQIAPYNYGANNAACPELWEAQLLTLKEVPRTGMAVINDVGDIKDIHPKNKQAVGHRLALWALAETYGQSQLVHSGPIYKKAQFKGDKAVLTFDHIGSGLAARDGQPLTHFTVAGEDQVFHPATAQIEGKTLVVRSDAVPSPVAVRFAWDGVAEPNLMNTEGLPASPFRTDTWKGITQDAN